MELVTCSASVGRVEAPAVVDATSGAVLLLATMGVSVDPLGTAVKGFDEVSLLDFVVPLGIDSRLWLDPRSKSPAVTPHPCASVSYPSTTP